MRKTYMMLVALVLSMLGVTSVNAAKIQRIALEKEMFKAWNGYGADAQSVEPESYIGKGDAEVNFSCDFNLYTTLGQGAVVYGNPNVYYKWYADLTGTKTMYFEGTPGKVLRVLFNRVEPVAGSDDPNGGKNEEKYVTIGEDGKASLDLSSYEYVHLNCIKTNWGVENCVITKIEIEGTVKPVTGWVDIIKNGDVEDGDDLSSFPVSRLGGAKDAEGKSLDPGNAAYSPEIVTDEDVENHNKVLKIVADDQTVDPDHMKETWQTQFFIKFNEALAEGTKWKLTMDVKSSTAAAISTSAQGAPRDYHAGFVNEFQTTTEWTPQSWEGTVTADQAKNGGFLSIAFDLNKSQNPIEFYFDNISFCKFVEGSNVTSEFTAEYGGNTVCLNLTDKTNIKNLVKAAGGERVVLPNNCVSVKWNGTDLTDMMSVEGRADGKLYAFINAFNEEYGESGANIDFLAEDAVVEVSFAGFEGDNQLKFVSGLLTDQAVPAFSGLACSYNVDLTEKISYRAIPPKVVSTVPEDGSFNLPLTMTEFKVTLDALANAETLKAQLGSENLTVSPAEGYAKEFTLTRTSAEELTKGQKVLKISDIEPEFNATEEYGEASVTLNFGPVEADPTDVPFDVIPMSYFQNCPANQIPEGFVHYADNMEKRTPGVGYGSGGRTFDISNTPDFNKGMYLRTNYLVYGEIEDHPLTLEEGKKYDISFNLAGWEGSTSYVKLQIVDAEENEYFSEILKTQGQAKETPQNSFAYKGSFIAPADANYLLKWVLCDKDGNATGNNWAAQFLANVKMSYVPNTVGAVETALLNEALEKATSVRDNNTAERYAGEDFTALDNAITKYTEEKAGYTGPSQFTDAAADLDALRLAMVDHRTACDDYDKAIKATIDVVRQITAEEDNGKPNEKKKFETTDEFAQVKAAADKYHGTSEWRNLADPDDPEADPNWQLFYEYDVLTDNAALSAAITELNAINNGPAKMFTVGVSVNNTTAGYAALYERTRRGIELLKALGVAEDADEIVRAKAELGDNDEVNASIMHRAEVEILADLAKGEESVLFKGKESEPDETTGEVTITYPSYDLSVFVKNPNLYAPAKSTVVPGWTNVKGNIYAWSSWNGALNHSNSTNYPEDCSLHAGWHPGGGAVVEQTITNLPAGVYTIKISSGDNNNPRSENTLGYVRTASSGKTPLADGASFDKTVNCDAYTEANDGSIENITVTDGNLTIGFSYGDGSQAFLNGVELIMIGKAADYDYAAAYATGIDGKKASKVRSIELYDVNGRRMTTARKGLVIVKKTMADGTVKTSKIVK